MNNDPFKKQLESARSERDGDSLISHSSEEKPQTETIAAAKPDPVQSESNSSTESTEVSQQTKTDDGNSLYPIAKFSAIGILICFVGFILFEQISFTVTVALIFAAILVVGKEIFIELGR